MGQKNGHRKNFLSIFHRLLGIISSFLAIILSDTAQGKVLHPIKRNVSVWCVCVRVCVRVPNNYKHACACVHTHACICTCNHKHGFGSFSHKGEYHYALGITHSVNGVDEDLPQDVLVVCVHCLWHSARNQHVHLYLSVPGNPSSFVLYTTSM